MSRLIVAFTATLLSLITSPLAAAQEIILGRHSSIIFATAKQGSEILARQDEYTARMSHFDRMLRLKSPQRVPPKRYAQYMAANTLQWSPGERERVSLLLRRLAGRLGGLDLPLPGEVLLIKTTGEEEVGQGHTRSNAIVLPQRSLSLDENELFFLIAHELFHVMTRHDAEFRRAAYALIGFRITDEVILPPAIANLQITNPDAPRHDSVIDLAHAGETVSVIPVLLSRSAVYDVQIGDELKHFWTLRLMVVDQALPDAAPRPRLRNGVPVLFRLNETSGFIDQVGHNTRYIIHAEEILAEHFAFMASGEPVPEPRRIEAMRRLLSERR